jgi:hypothetical protein
MIRITIICAVTFIACLSCRQEVTQPSCIIIDLEKAIDKSPVKLTLNDISENSRIISTETTDAILFENMSVMGITKENIIVLNSGPSNKETFLYFVNKETGKVSVLLNKQGAGPGEYRSIIDVVIKEQDSIVYVSDIQTMTIHTYNFHGNFINSFKNDSVQIFNLLNDGNFAVGFPSYLQLGYALGIYDKSLNLKRIGIPKVYKKTAMTYLDAINKFNNEYYYHVALGDTLYQITSEYEKPYLVRSKGVYKLPVEVAASLSELEKNYDRYIQGDYGYIISKYYFLSYTYGGATYYDIWDLKTSTLIYRNKKADNDATSGIPVSIDSVKINVWPRYVDGDMMYCTIEAEDAVKLIPSLPWDTNPIILEIKIKK